MLPHRHNFRTVLLFLRNVCNSDNSLTSCSYIYLHLRCYIIRILNIIVKIFFHFIVWTIFHTIMAPIPSQTLRTFDTGPSQQTSITRVLESRLYWLSWKRTTDASERLRNEEYSFQLHLVSRIRFFPVIRKTNL